MEKITLESIVDQNPPMSREQMFERIFNCDYLTIEEKGCFLINLKEDEIYNKWALMHVMLDYVYFLFRSKGLSAEESFYRFYDKSLNHPNWTAAEVHLVLLCLVQPEISVSYIDYIKAEKQ